MANIYNDFKLLDSLNLDEVMWDGDGRTRLVIDDAYHVLISDNIFFPSFVNDAYHALISDEVILTAIESPALVFSVLRSGVWKEGLAASVLRSGVWKEIEAVNVLRSGAWKT